MNTLLFCLFVCLFNFTFCFKGISGERKKKSDGPDRKAAAKTCKAIYPHLVPGFNVNSNNKEKDRLLDSSRKGKRIVKEKDSQGKLHAVRFIEEKDTFLDSSRKKTVMEKDRLSDSSRKRTVKEKEKLSDPSRKRTVKEKDRLSDSSRKKRACRSHQGKGQVAGAVKEKHSQGKSHAVGFIKEKDSQGNSHAVIFINEEKDSQGKRQAGGQVHQETGKMIAVLRPTPLPPRPLCPPPRQCMQTPSIALRHPSFLGAGCLKAMLGVCAIYAVSVTLKCIVCLILPGLACCGEINGSPEVLPPQTPTSPTPTPHCPYIYIYQTMHRHHSVSLITIH